MRKLTPIWFLLIAVITTGCQSRTYTSYGAPTVIAKTAIARNPEANSFHVAVKFFEAEGLRRTFISSSAFDVALGVPGQATAEWNGRKVIGEALIRADKGDYVDRQFTLRVLRAEGGEGSTDMVSGSFLLSPRKDKLKFSQ